MTSSAPNGHAALASTARAWLALDPDANSRSALEQLLADAAADPSKPEAAAELKAAFASRLEFGTAGLRGIVGPGPARMNRLVVMQTTAGLARYVHEQHGEQAGVVVAYDGRLDSEAFAHAASGVLAAAGVKVHLFAVPAPTPMCGFMVRRLSAAAGIVVTASHNPPEYNGYKVYCAAGTQINDPVDGEIAAHINAVAEEGRTPSACTLDEARAQGMLSDLGEEDFETYIGEVLRITPAPSASTAAFKVAYTPLHGVGAHIGERLLKRRGYQSFTVAEQREPDGHFPTVKFPNPEEPGAMDLVMALADAKQCPVAIANDPDADRLCAAARDSTGKLRQLTGDEIGTLLGDAMLRQLCADGAASPPWVLSTIASSRLLARLAGAYGARHRETLTGFKWLGPAASALEAQGERFAFAYEEALGYMANSLVWDKDGLSALLVLADLACALDAQGQTLLDRLEEIQRRVGVAITTQRTIRLQPGTSGGSIMKRVRAQKPSRIGQYELALIEDLLEGRPPAETPAGEIPKNDMLRYFFVTDGLSKDSPREEIKLGAPRIQVRPSGTEPKVKIYCEALGEVGVGESFEGAQQRIREELNAIVDVVYDWLVADA